MIVIGHTFSKVISEITPSCISSEVNASSTFALARVCVIFEKPAVSVATRSEREASMVSSTQLCNPRQVVKYGFHP